MQAALELAQDHAAREGATRIHRVVLRVGELSGVVPDALEFAFDVLTRGSIAEGATLTVERVPVACACDDCGRAFEPPEYDFRCPCCLGPHTRILTGGELDLASLEVS